MSLPIRSANSSATRSFAGQATLILLPVVILAILAAAALRADRRQVEERARDLVATTGPALVRSVAERFRSLLEDYQEARSQSLSVLPRDRGVSSALNQWLGAKRSGPNAQLGATVKAGDFLPDAIFDNAGSLLDPRPYPRAPQPPAWWLDLSPELKAQWEEARRLESQSAPGAEVIPAYERCREVVTNGAFDANVLFALRRLNATGQEPDAAAHSLLTFSVAPNVLSPAGVPIAALVLFEALAKLDGAPLPQLAIRHLGEAVTQFPSILTPILLERATRNETNSTSSEVEALKLRWSADERLRALARSAQFPTNTLPQLFWLVATGDRTLAITAPFQSVQEQDGLYFTNALMAATFVPAPVIRQLLQTAIEANNNLVPAYASVEASFSRERLFELAEVPAVELGRVGQNVFDNPSIQAPLKLTLRLAHPELLYADQRRREGWTAALILCAVGAAAFGVWNAWRTLKRQLGLNAQQANFVSAVSHELRAPLASLRLLAEGLANGYVREEPRRREYAGYLVDETRRLGALIDNVLNFARLDQGRARLELAPTDVRRLIGETMDRFRPVAAGIPIALRVEDQLGPASPEPEWDGLAVQQALSNLLDNALKHSPPESEVVVAIFVAAENPNHLMISVRDQGPGIPSDQHARIFERFYRLGSELRRETRGVGLGLALVRQIAEAHGGKAIVVSTQGQGSTFVLELPVSLGKTAEG